MLHIPIILSECKCSRFGSENPNCDDSGNCECKSVFQGPKCMHCKNSNHTGSRCDDCIPGYYGFPDCKGNINPMLDFRISLSLANSCFLQNVTVMRLDPDSHNATRMSLLLNFISLKILKAANVFAKSTLMVLSAGVVRIKITPIQIVLVRSLIKIVSFQSIMF